MLPDIFQTVKEAADLPTIVETLTCYPGHSEMYHCPLCNSGTGPNHTGAFHIYQENNAQRWYCHSCNRGGDVIDLAGYLLGTDDKTEQIHQVMEWIGMREDDLQTTQSTSYTRPRAQRPAHAEAPTKEYIEYERSYIACAQTQLPNNPEAIAYLQSRGIDTESALNLGLGYDPNCRRIVIPFPGSSYYHIDRAIDADGKGKYLKPNRKDAGPQPLWNPGTLEGDQIIVVEGPLDALALTMAGFGDQTVALCGTAWRDLASELQARKYAGVALIALDADDPGKDAQKALTEALSADDVLCTGLDVWDRLEVKDAAEAWQVDHEAMTRALAQAITEGTKQAKAEREEKFQASIKSVRIVSATMASQNILTMAGMRDPILTGFASIDNALGGGLFPGLYVLGSYSGYGKTTLLGQAADHVAKSGCPVVFVSLEQSAEEMAAKSISRELVGIERDDDNPYQVTALDLMNPLWRNDPHRCTPGQQRAIVAAVQTYLAGVEDRLIYVVARDEPSVMDIQIIAAHEAEKYGRAPLVIVDYLQIVRPPQDYLSDKQALDKNVSAMRRLARDLATPVIAVSSLNRMSYSGPIVMEAFKESGSIEYGSDVLLGLQSQGMAEKSGEKGKNLVNDTRSKAQRELELAIIKNRWGRPTKRGEGIPLTFYAITSRFEDDPQWRPSFN